jgi:competence protein ComEC
MWGVPQGEQFLLQYLPAWLRPVPPDDPLDRLVEETTPFAWRVVLGLWRSLLTAFFASLVVGVVVAPLVAGRMHMFAPIGVVLGPPVVLLTSIALVTGFLMLVSAAVCPPLVPLFAWPTSWSLAGCDWLVDRADGLPLSHFYVPDLPEWWLWGLYGAFFAAIWLPSLRRWWLAAGLVGWVCVGLLGGAAQTPTDELRCTFLSVGHGTCVVLETPDGRVLLYDAGSLAGPDAARRQVAPYLWHRGIRRIDEVMLSHADLDHFNGLPALVERFNVGQVTRTPSFADKRTPGVIEALALLEKRGVPVRTVSAGQRLSTGEVEMRVLHPPAEGPEGNENARSLVLLVRHANHTILLTGDLEGTGLARVLSLPPVPVQVLMAPHHGSPASNIPPLAAWTQPTVVVSSQRRGEGRKAREVYAAVRAAYLGTDEHGAVTVRSHATGVVVETFRTGKQIVLPR